jgi:CoA:oxalate CoA-transferase
MPPTAELLGVPNGATVAEMSPRGPLAGLLVVDLTRVLAGPFATMMMADLGARVVKVERPDHGDDSRSYGPFVDGRSTYFARVNRGKESIALDLKAAADRDVLIGLADRADVLVENFRPGVLEKWGLGPDVLLQRNPRLVVLRVTGFGQEGPYSERRAFGTLMEAMSELASESSTQRPREAPTERSEGER